MRCSTVEERFADLVRHPSAEQYLAVRELIVQLDEYCQQGHQLMALGVDFEAERYEDVLQTVEQWRVWASLCPRFHFLRGVAAAELGDFATASQAKTEFQACLRGLIETGDGDQGHPFLVTYVTDAYDILRSLDEVPLGQSVVEVDARQFDLIHVEGDDEPYWFDVSTLLRTSVSSKQRAHLLA